MTISKDLIKAYRHTHYCVSAGNEFVMHIAQASEEARELMKNFSAQGAIFITAWNPLGEVLSDSQNKKVNSILKNELEGVAQLVLAGHGSSPDGSWKEESFFALPVSKAAATELCRRYAQNAVVFVGSDGVPELLTHPSIGTL